MESYSMFLGRKNQYCENDYTTKCNLQIQCNPCQITNGIFHRTRTKNVLICMVTHKTSDSQSRLAKEKCTISQSSLKLMSIESVMSYQFFKALCCAHAQSVSCLTLCDPRDYSPPGSSFHGILQARILEQVGISFSFKRSNRLKRLKVKSFYPQFFGPL